MILFCGVYNAQLPLPNCFPSFIFYVFLASVQDNGGKPFTEHEWSFQLQYTCFWSVNLTQISLIFHLFSFYLLPRIVEYFFNNKFCHFPQQ